MSESSVVYVDDNALNYRIFFYTLQSQMYIKLLSDSRLPWLESCQAYSLDTLSTGEIESLSV